MKKTFVLRSSFLLTLAFLFSINAFSQSETLGWKDIHQTGALSVIVNPYVISPTGEKVSVGDTGRDLSVVIHMGVCAKFLGGNVSDYIAIDGHLGNTTNTLALYNPVSSEFDLKTNSGQSGFSYITCLSKKPLAAVMNDGTSVNNGETTYLRPRLFINEESFRPVFDNVDSSVGDILCAIHGHSTFVETDTTLRKISESVIFQEYFWIDKKEMAVDVEMFDVTKLLDPSFQYPVSHIETLTCK